MWLSGLEGGVAVGTGGRCGCQSADIDTGWPGSKRHLIPGHKHRGAGVAVQQGAGVAMVPAPANQAGVVLQDCKPGGAGVGPLNSSCAITQPRQRHRLLAHATKPDLNWENIAGWHRIPVHTDGSGVAILYSTCWGFLEAIVPGFDM